MFDAHISSAEENSVLGLEHTKKTKNKKIIRRPYIRIICFGFRIQKKYGITMQPPRMTFSLSGGPGNTYKNIVANALQC